MANSTTPTLEQLVEKLATSKALNGGFDKLTEKMEQVSIKLERVDGRVEQISDRLDQIDVKVEAAAKTARDVEHSLLSPTDGIYKQLSDHTHNLKAMTKALEDHIVDEDPKLDAVINMQPTVARLTEVGGGPGLDKLSYLLNYSAIITKLFWTVFAFGGGALCKYVLDVWFTSHAVVSR